MVGQANQTSQDDYHEQKAAKREEAGKLTASDYPKEFVGTSPIKVNKVGHFLYEVSDIELTAKFWTDVMGFKETDRNEKGMIFYRCGADHHAIGLRQSNAKRRPHQDEWLRMEHLAFEVDDVDILFKARDFLRANNIPIVFEGRKGAGCNVALHFTDPDGYEFELYCEMDQIDKQGHLRPAEQFRRAQTLEDAVANPVAAKKW